MNTDGADLRGKKIPSLEVTPEADPPSGGGAGVGYSCPPDSSGERYNNTTILQIRYYSNLPGFQNLEGLMN
jgi:hypothetical protein